MKSHVTVIISNRETNGSHQGLELPITQWHSQGQCAITSANQAKHNTNHSLQCIVAKLIRNVHVFLNTWIIGIATFQFTVKVA